jgi:hypothetical protein
VNTQQGTDDELIARLVEVLLRRRQQRAEQQQAHPFDPEARISDPVARRTLYGDCSRTKFWMLMKKPGAPPGNRVGRSMLRRVRDHLEFIAEHPDR